MSQQFQQGDKVSHYNYGTGKILEVGEVSYRIDFGKRGVIEISKRSEDLERSSFADASEDKEELTMSILEKTLRRVLEEYSDVSQVINLGDRWAGGTMILKPANPNQKAKEVPIETFFHKIVMVRDRLRVLEQNINSNDKLTDEEKVNIQQYITRCYGSLTTFNVLFRDQEDWFVGEKK